MPPNPSNKTEVKVGLPPTLNRPSKHNRFPDVNTSVLILQKYGQELIDALSEREQREILGTALYQEQAGVVTDSYDPATGLDSDLYF